MNYSGLSNEELVRKAEEYGIRWMRNPRAIRDVIEPTGTVGAGSCRARPGSMLVRAAVTALSPGYTIRMSLHLIAISRSWRRGNQQT